jgi:hypothetical protein
MERMRRAITNVLRSSLHVQFQTRIGLYARCFKYFGDKEDITFVAIANYNVQVWFHVENNKVLKIHTSFIPTNNSGKLPRPIEGKKIDGVLATIFM